MNTKNNNVYHLGLTMAGAVSAGCYTSGVIDYLFETPARQSLFTSFMRKFH